MEHCVVPALFRTAVKSKWDMVWGLKNKMYGWQGVRAGLNWARGEQLGDPKVPVHDLEGHHGPKYKGTSFILECVFDFLTMCGKVQLLRDVTL